MSILPPAVPSVSELQPLGLPVFWSESFDTLDLARWREVELWHQTRYEIAELEGQRCLRATSHRGASILLTAVKFRPATYPWLSWRWRIEQPVDHEDLTRKEGSDASARVYVYFDSKGLPWQKRNIDYVWSSTLPLETLLTSPFSSSSKILVVDGGAATIGKWRVIERNLNDDYRRVFGEAPSRVVAIGLMTDTDTMGGDAQASFDELRVSHEPLFPHSEAAAP